MAFAFLVTTLAVRIAVECLGGVGIMGWAAATQGSADPVGLQSAMENLPIGLIAGMTIVQLAALGAVAIGFAALWSPVRETLALRVGSAPVWGIAAAAGLLVGLGPGWFAEILANTLPDWLQLGALDQIAPWFQDGSLAGQLLMGLAVVVFAPLCEELVFRGYLWDACRRFAPEWAVWIGTSALFAAYHIDPVHVITVFPIGLLIGWVRYTSGSLPAAMLVHLLNNALAAVLAVAAPPDLVVPWWVGVPALVLTVAIAAPAWMLRYRPVATAAEEV